MQVTEPIEELHKKWIAAELHDPMGILEFCTEDIAFHLDEHKIIKGTEAISSWIQDSYQNIRLKSIEIKKLQIHHLGPLASLIADFRTTYLTPGQNTEEIHGQHFWVLQKIKGRWWVKSITWKVFQM